MGKDQTEPTEAPAAWKPVLGLSDEPGALLELPVRAGKRL